MDERRLRLRRLGFLCALAVLAAAGTAAVSSDLPEPLGLGAALRNLALFTGFAVAAAVLLGYRHAWIAPATWGFMCLTAGMKHGIAKPWALPLHDDGSVAAAMASLFLIGVAAVVLACDLLAPWARPGSAD